MGLADPKNKFLENNITGFRRLLATHFESTVPAQDYIVGNKKTKQKQREGFEQCYDVRGPNFFE